MRDHVYELLLGLLISGELRPGDRITERALALRFGSSTTPVKEALRRLENEGFVRTLPRRGVIVSETAVASVADTIVLRASIESLAARLTAERFGGNDLDDADRARIAAAVDAMDETDPDTDELAEANAEFHELIRELAGNHMLSQVVGMLLGVEAALRRRALREPDEARRGREEHRRVAEAILAGDADLAERLMREHVLRSGSHTLGVEEEP